MMMMMMMMMITMTIMMMAMMTKRTWRGPLIPIGKNCFSRVLRRPREVPFNGLLLLLSLCLLNFVSTSVG